MQADQKALSANAAVAKCPAAPCGKVYCKAAPDGCCQTWLERMPETQRLFYEELNEAVRVHIENVYDITEEDEIEAAKGLEAQALGSLPVSSAPHFLVQEQDLPSSRVSSDMEQRTVCTLASS
ncbi:hypothetical protein EIP86_007254 [Pleurotus ostreatoroseus]|nr:hypothetical protein EIP86_007254 [Pleurotus ostreatoroseus]